MRWHVILALSLALPVSACDIDSSSESVGGVSASEARALNEAAEMLDKRPASPAAVSADDTPK